MSYVELIGKSGRFKARKRVNGKLVSRNFGTAWEAHRWLADGSHESCPASPGITDPAAAVTGCPTLTLAAFIEDGGYVTANLRPTTQLTYASLMKKHVMPRWGDVPLDRIEHRAVQRWLIDDVMAEGRSPQTVVHVKKLMQRMMAAALRQNLIAKNPVVGTVTARVEQFNARFLTPSEIDKLALQMEEPFDGFVKLAAYSGLRLGEMLGLRWSRVDLAKATVEVSEIATDLNGATTMGTPKTAAGRRTVAIPRSVAELLRDHKRAVGANIGPNAFVFPGANDRPLQQHNFRHRVWTPAVKAAGLDPLRVHDLRHTAVALWIASGFDLLRITKMIGHTSVAFTQDRYGHLFPDQPLKEMKVLERMIRDGKL